MRSLVYHKRSFVEGYEPALAEKIAGSPGLRDSCKKAGKRGRRNDGPSSGACRSLRTRAMVCQRTAFIAWAGQALHVSTALS